MINNDNISDSRFKECVQTVRCTTQEGFKAVAR